MVLVSTDDPPDIEADSVTFVGWVIAFFYLEEVRRIRAMKNTAILKHPNPVTRK